ncbi:MAG: glycoside hydrolase family 2 TIM barrel-domain containing protein [Bacteroidota bacterium]
MKNIFLDSSKPRNIFLLNGLWEVISTSNDKLPENYESQIPVPSLIDSANPPTEWQNNKFHFYRLKIQIDNLNSDLNYFLKIYQSMYGTKLWINRQFVGENISCYTSQTYDTSKYLNANENEIVIRIGQRSDLPPESAVGKDLEREIYIPGIWGDIELYSVNKGEIKFVKIFPKCTENKIEFNFGIENYKFQNEEYILNAEILEKKTKKIISVNEFKIYFKSSKENLTFTNSIAFKDFIYWSPENPFLYELKLKLFSKNEILDETTKTFGMREFKIEGDNFYLNGNKILLRGGNIAFHRFLSDEDRKLLPWNLEWVKDLLITIPKEHNFNFIRFHIGLPYHRWYDLADEYGILLQDEWQFWGVTGEKNQIKKEFTEWINDNCNHPSIIIWDPINESSDKILQEEIVPEMKKIDSTRPWESVDFIEEHPYIYSLGMVLNNRKFGFVRGLDEVTKDSRPKMFNEFLWWWLDKNNKPTLLMNEVIERWLGKNYSQNELIEHQSFLAKELIGLFRIMKINAIQPFVYLSNNSGATGNWFLNNIKDLETKPVLRAIKEAFEPFSVCIDLWDRHFFVDEEREIRFFIFNDSSKIRRGELIVGVKSSDNKWISRKEISVEVLPMSDIVLVEELVFPSSIGENFAVAELFEENQTIAISKKVIHTFEVIKKQSRAKKIILLNPSEEMKQYFESIEISTTDYSGENLSSSDIIIVNGNIFSNKIYTSNMKIITEFVQNGGTIIINEPEYGVVGTTTKTIVDGVDLNITHRSDSDKGGYDSYVFAEDQSHPIWKNIHREHLKIFNGAYGGEIVSQYDVDFSVQSKRLASCGNNLNVVAVSEVEYGKGKIILSRIQIRERLIAFQSSYKTLFARRPDPVAQQYVLNLIHYS